MEERKNLVNKIMKGRERRYSPVCWRTENLAEKMKKFFWRIWVWKQLRPCCSILLQVPPDKIPRSRAGGSSYLYWPRSLFVPSATEISVKGNKAGTWGCPHRQKLQQGKGICQKEIVGAVKRSKAFEEDHQLAQEQPAWVLVNILNHTAVRVAPSIFTLKCLTSGLIFKLTAVFQGFQ